MARSRKNRHRGEVVTQFQVITAEQRRALRKRGITKISDLNKILCWFSGEKHPTFTSRGLAVRYGGGRGVARVKDVPGGYTVAD